MNYTELFQKLVNLLGTSEFDLNLQKIFTELGEKFPLKRPRKGDTGYLLEKENRNYQLAMKYAEAIPFLKEDKKLKEGELVFYSLQNIYYNSDYEDVVFPFNITWNLNPKQAIQLLGEDYFKYDNSENVFLWRKGDIVIILEFDDEDYLIEISYRLLINYDLEILEKHNKN